LIGWTLSVGYWYCSGAFCLSLFSWIFRVGYWILAFKTKKSAGLFNASIFTPPLCLKFPKKSKSFEHNYALIFISYWGILYDCETISNPPWADKSQAGAADRKSSGAAG
jgi:hypothetical protein